MMMIFSRQSYSAAYEPVMLRFVFLLFYSTLLYTLYFVSNAANEKHRKRKKTHKM